MYLPKSGKRLAREAAGPRNVLLASLAGATPPSDAGVARTAPQPGAKAAHPTASPSATSTLAKAIPQRTPAANTARTAESAVERPQASTSIAISCRVVALVDDTCAAVLLSQLIYWSRRGREVSERDGWIHKTAREWEIETGLSWKMQRRARRILSDLGLVEERLQAMPACLEFRLHLPAFLPEMAKRSEIEMPPLDWSWITDREDPLFGRLLGRSFLFNAALTAYMSVPAAMMASRLLSAQGAQAKRTSDEGKARPRRNGALVQMQREEWRLETGLTRHQWQTARRDLRALDLLIERKANYPRRVDLGIDPRGVAALLAAPARARVRPGARIGGDAVAGQAAEAGSVWAKQEGRFGYHPKQPADSPKPADSPHPNRPIPIAQTGFYLSQLQVQLHHLPQPSAFASSVDWTIPQWGWGGPGDVLKKAALAPTTANNRTEPPLVDLVWPAIFDVEDRAAAQKHLSGLDRAIQQTLLDEIDWQHAQKPVRSPVALLRTLSRKARAGEFTADGAHRISSARRKRLQADQARQRAASLGTGTRTEPNPATLSEDAVAKLRALGATLRGRRRSA